MIEWVSLIVEVSKSLKKMMIVSPQPILIVSVQHFDIAVIFLKSG